MSKDKQITITMTEQEALDLTILMTDVLATYIHERRSRPLEKYELRIKAMIESVQPRIDIKLMALHDGQSKPQLRLIDGQSSQD